MKKERKVHLELAAQLNLFGGDPQKKTLCNRNPDKLETTKTSINISCKQCLKKLRV